MRAPDFWYRQPRGTAATLLTPLGVLYSAVVQCRSRSTRSWRSPVPVLCVGNLVVGGTGKTPVCLSIGERLASQGLNVHFLSRGYGGSMAGPVQVMTHRHEAHEVGDEPLLLARVRPTWVSRDRRAGILAAVTAGAHAIVMDDGFQNPAVAKHIALVVVDGARGFGNGLPLPAGPLREPVAAGLKRADGIVLIGPDATGALARVSGLPVLGARLHPQDHVAQRLAGRKVVAFAGIGHPQKFFRTLRTMGCVIEATHAFADHHVYRPDEVAAIIRQARASGATAVTTAKDAVRLPLELRSLVESLDVSLQWADEARLDTVLRPMHQNEISKEDKP